jgi:hypothetical protein
MTGLCSRVAPVEGLHHCFASSMHPCEILSTPGALATPDATGPGPGPADHPAALKTFSASFSQCTPPQYLERTRQSVTAGPKPCTPAHLYSAQTALTASRSSLPVPCTPPLNPQLIKKASVLNPKNKLLNPKPSLVLCTDCLGRVQVQLAVPCIPPLNPQLTKP